MKMKTQLRKAEKVKGNEKADAVREKTMTRLDTLKSQGIQEDDEDMEYIADEPGMGNTLKLGPRRSTLTQT